jgi:glycosyltransferase involved in cell wall biosynthesis
VKIVAYIHMAAPWHLAGSESMLHTMLEHAVQSGHEAHIIVTAHTPDEGEDVYDWNGVTVHRSLGVRTPESILTWIQPDVILTHHNETFNAAKQALRFRVPLVQVIHNEMPHTARFHRASTNLFVYNSNWVRDSFSKYRKPNLVVHPPVDASMHATKPGDRITLVNLSANKGANTFYELAKRMPDREFLAVEGGHGTQIIAPAKNITFVPQTSNMREDVWARTRVLLMPSIYESYGLAGIEALSSGIPVLAHPTPGLIESLGFAGTFLDRDDVDSWERVLRLLQVQPTWNAQSKISTARFESLDTEREMTSFVEALESLVEKRSEIGLRDSRRR